MKLYKSIQQFRPLSALSLTVAAISVPTMSHAAATLELDYECVFPVVEEQPLQVKISAEIPATYPANTMTQPFTITAISTVAESARNALSFLGARSFTGTATSESTISGPGLNLPLNIPIEIANSSVPTEAGAFDIEATGTTPALSFNEGEYEITVGNIVINMLPVDANGTTVGSGPVESECTQLPGQDNVLQTIVVGDVTTPPDDATVNATLTGSTTVNGSDTPLNGAINGSVGTDGELLADLSFDQTTLSVPYVTWPFFFRIEGAMSVEPTAELEGQLSADGTLTATVPVNISVPNPAFKFFGFTFFGGSGLEQCQTASPVTMKLSGSGLTEAGGSITGTYTVGTWENCGSLGSMLRAVFSNAPTTVSFTVN